MSAKYFGGLITFLELIIILGYLCLTTYKANGSSAIDADSNMNLLMYYPCYVDVTVMVFIGFGFLMTFLKSHSWSSVGLNYFIAVLSIQIFILWNGFW